MARPAARADRAVRLRCRGGEGDRAQLVVQRTAPAGARRCGRRCDVRPGRAVRNGRRMMVFATYATGRISSRYPLVSDV
ncbi:hypothetical protein SGPA1_31325 [Streptomyces misionensis JCM 4497]